MPVKYRQMSVIFHGSGESENSRSTFDVPEGTYDSVDIMIDEEIVYTFPVEIELTNGV